LTQKQELEGSTDEQILERITHGWLRYYLVNLDLMFSKRWDVSVLMAMMTVGECEKTASVCDPCVGSGRMLMTASNYSLNLFGVDIDYRILNICKANMWMYVPWGIVRPADWAAFAGIEPAMIAPEEHTKAHTEELLPLEPAIQQVTPEIQQDLLNYTHQLDLFGSGAK